MKNIIVTGIPRSGTSLLTTLIDSTPNAVGLHEPYWQAEWASQNKNKGASAFVEYLIQNFSSTRQKLLNGHTVHDRRDAAGNSVTNYYVRNDDGTVNETFKLRPINPKSINDDFVLAMKHCGLYLGVLDEIAKSNQFAIIAIIRKKEDVLKSWRSLPNIPPNRGRLPGAEVYCPKIREIVSRNISTEYKQELIYDYAYEKITKTETIEVVFYEEMVRNKKLETDKLRHLNIDYSAIKIVGSI
jgi:hypothetical protein